MAAHVVNLWQSAKDAFTGGAEPQANAERVTVTEDQAYTLPHDTRYIRVLMGGAWISIMGEDLVLTEGEALKLRPDHQGVVVTAIGHRPLRLEMLG